MPYNYSDINEVTWLLDKNKAISLFKKENAALIISFLFNTYKSNNRQSSTYTNSDLTSRLSDYLYSLNQSGTVYPRSAKEYLESWTNEGFLRKYYEPGSDEALFDLTPAMETAFFWLEELNNPAFVGTASRLKNIFDLLKEIVSKSSNDKDKRIKELKDQKEKIDLEIQKIHSGEIEIYDDVKIQETFYFIEETATKLLSDFRQIEQNFRELNKDAREKQIKSELSKGKFLDDIFKAQDIILETDQGKSFKAFWEFLMDQNKQEELNQLINTVLNLPQIKSIIRNRIIENLKTNLVEAGDKVNKTNDLLIEQLRYYLDTQIFFENKRISELIREIEDVAIKIKDNAPTDKDFVFIDGKLKIDMVMERRMYHPPKKPDIQSNNITEGVANFSTDVLFQQLYVNPEVLKGRIRLALRNKSQVSLKQLTEDFEIEKGLTEVVTYFSIASGMEESQKAHINRTEYEEIFYKDLNQEKYNKVSLPLIIFFK